MYPPLECQTSMISKQKTFSRLLLALEPIMSFSTKFSPFIYGWLMNRENFT